MDTIDLANAAEAAYKDLVILADRLDELHHYMQQAKSPMVDAFAEDVFSLFVDADVAAGHLSYVIHDQIEIDDDTA